VKTCAIGSYPKIPAGPGPSVRTAIQRFEQFKIGPAELERTYREVTERVLTLAQEVGLDLTTDGQIRWYDLFDPLARDVDNFRPAGLLRLFDNNFYYRHPVITGRLQYQGGTLAQWTRQARRLTSVPLLVALPGPWTIVALSEDQTYHNRAQWLRDIVEVLQLEVLSLAEVGVAEVQWDEPALAAGAIAVQPREVSQIYQDLVDASPIPMAIALYWGRSTPWLSALNAVEWHRISVDVVKEPEVADALMSGVNAKHIGLGLLDAREVRLESVDQLARQLEPLLRQYGTDQVWVHPNSGLELLPPDRAEAKLRLLGALKKTIDG
jgi:5-methyltetrahydropteroyltriglutamate--homocysteine methyltransferase